MSLRKLSSCRIELAEEGGGFFGGPKRIYYDVYINRTTFFRHTESQYEELESSIMERGIVSFGTNGGKTYWIAQGEEFYSSDLNLTEEEALLLLIDKKDRARQKIDKLREKYGDEDELSSLL